MPITSVFGHRSTVPFEQALYFTNKKAQNIFFESPNQHTREESGKSDIWNNPKPYFWLKIKGYT
jgi:hypothetical protein